MPIKKLSLCISTELNPYRNLALEETLLRRVGESELILYLWRNEKTVVVGRHQNIRSEVNLAELDRIGGYPTRRISGGGAVYHDAGNLNFTFISMEANLDISRQTEVILNAVRALGFNASKTGRNDLCIDGRKFSGHSYYHSGDRGFHNGTILISTDADTLSKVLNVSALKLQSKGVKSVKSRTVNLSELEPGIGIETVMNAVTDAFEKEYGMKAEPCGTDPDPELVKKFSDPEWIFNKIPEYDRIIEKRFPWGNAEIHLKYNRGKLADWQIFTDSLEELPPDLDIESLID